MKQGSRTGGHLGEGRGDRMCKGPELECALEGMGMCGEVWVL